MKVTSIGMLLLAIWLIVACRGLCSGDQVRGFAHVMAGLAIAAGVFD